VLGVLAFLLVLVCAVLTASRGGQLVFLAVLAAYCVKRPASSACYSAARWPCHSCCSAAVARGRLQLDARAHRLLGGGHQHVALSSATRGGLGQFNEYHYMTAHNSYLLALAELGLPGMFLFGAMLYLSAKIPVCSLRHLQKASAPEILAGAELTRAWAVALLAAFIGLAVGIFFLSFTYHYVLWIYLGLSGAFYGAVRKHDPSFRVRLNGIGSRFHRCCQRLRSSCSSSFTRAGSWADDLNQANHLRPACFVCLIGARCAAARHSLRPARFATQCHG